MIQANELRLNNYLHLDGAIYQINEIYNRLQCVELKRKNQSNPNLNEYEECDLDCENLEPIELTEKIILSCGFKERKSIFGYWIYEIEFQNTVFSVEEVDLGLCYFYVGNTHVSQTRYVHELQNLYFAITGEELVFSTEP